MMELPNCPKCSKTKMVPLSDYGQDGSSVTFKAWACLDKACGHALYVDKGTVFWGIKKPNQHQGF